MGIIYKISNTYNDKIYIGQTITSLNERWSGHRCDAKRKNTPLYALMKKFNDNVNEVFSIEVIEEIDDELLDEREIYWIKKYNSLFPKGFNMSEGGQSYLTESERLRMSERVKGENNPMYGKFGELNPFYGKCHSVETKKLMSEKAKCRVISEETKNKIGESTKIRHQINGHPFKGKNHSVEAKRRISEKMKGRVFSEETIAKMKANNKRKRPVDMLDKLNNYIKTFDSMTEASEWLIENTKYVNGRHTDISSVCLGKRKTAYGYKWRYSEGSETIQ